MTNFVIEIQAPQLTAALMALAQALHLSPAAPAAAPAAPVNPIPAAPVVTPASGMAQTAPSISTPAAVPISVPPAGPMAPAPIPAPAVPVAQAPEYTMEQLATAATPVVDAGRREDIVQLIRSFGVDSLPKLPKEQYGAFATALRALGGQI